MQVLANPTSELQEGADVSRDQLKSVGVRPYDEKVLCCVFDTISVVALSEHQNGWYRSRRCLFWCQAYRLTGLLVGL